MEMNRIEELLATTKLNDMMHKKDDDQKTTVLWILAIIGAVAAVAAIALAAFHNFGVEYNGVRNCICSILFLYSGLSGRL